MWFPGTRISTYLKVAVMLSSDYFSNRIQLSVESVIFSALIVKYTQKSLCSDKKLIKE